MEDFRRLHPRLDRFNRVAVPSGLILAGFCLPLAVVDPWLLVFAACFALFAGMLRLIEWISAKGTTPAERKVLEQRLAERAARKSRKIP